MVRLVYVQTCYNVFFCVCVCVSFKRIILPNVVCYWFVCVEGALIRPVAAVLDKLSSVRCCIHMTVYRGHVTLYSNLTLNVMYVLLQGRIRDANIFNINVNIIIIIMLYWLT